MRSHEIAAEVFSVLLILAVVLTLMPVSASAAPGKDVGEQVRLQVLTINDFHGQIQSYSATLGGAANLAGYFNEREAAAKLTNTDTWCLGGGDLIGASPAVSALLQDEPTMQVLDEMDFESRPWATTSSMRASPSSTACSTAAGTRPRACGPARRCSTWRPMWSTRRPARRSSRATRSTACAGARGHDGVVTEETPGVVTASGVAGLEFTDAATAVNDCVAELKAKGVETIIVLAHEGGAGNTTGGPITGNIVPLVTAMDDEVDVVFSAHSHSRYWGYIDGKLVTQAHSAGRAFADVDLVIDRKSGEVVSKVAEIVTTTITPTLVPDLVFRQSWMRPSPRLHPIVNQVVATAAADIARAASPAGEQALGNLVADAQRWKQGTQIAFMNPGGIRADMAAGEVTYGELFAVQPFNNYLVTMKLTGAQLDPLLEQQWQATATRMLQISGISYAWSASAPRGSRIDPASILVGGVPVDPGCDLHRDREQLPRRGWRRLQYVPARDRQGLLGQRPRRLCRVRHAASPAVQRCDRRTDAGPPVGHPPEDRPEARVRVAPGPLRCPSWQQPLVSPPSAQGRFPAVGARDGAWIRKRRRQPLHLRGGASDDRWGRSKTPAD